jgi:hypothetical protein
MSSPVCFDEGQTCDSLALRKAKRAINQRHYSAQVSKCVASMFFEDLAMFLLPEQVINDVVVDSPFALLLLPPCRCSCSIVLS